MRSGFRFTVVLAAVMSLAAGIVTVASAHPEGPAHHAPTPPHATEVMRNFAADVQPAAIGEAIRGGAACDGGEAAGYPCRNVDLLSYLPLSDIGGTRSNSAANDIWGWTHTSAEGDVSEYAIIGRVFGTSFIDISVPTDPVYLGELPTHGAFGSSWRDIKVYADHAFIVSEAMGHGMQVFDLGQLETMPRSGTPVTFAETAHYNKVASAHNIAINEVSGFAYIVGASGKNSCSGGLHMVDITTPASPSFAGCFSADGYTHDTQCVNYGGLDPDPRYHDREICFNSNEDTVTIVDVTEKSNPVQLARIGYDGSGYTHQGWLTEDRSHFLLDDELDERDFDHGTRTRVWDVSDLTAPTLVNYFTNDSTAIDHNQYVRGTYSYQANYRAGLRILDITALPDLGEVGYFDVYPANDNADFNGAWSTYPYFPSGVVIVSGIEQGLFVLQPQLTGATADVNDTNTPVVPGGGDPGTDPVPMHVGDLDGSTSARGKGWQATVTITVHDSNEDPVSGVTVAGTWTSPGATGASCQTGSAGTCTVKLSRIDDTTTQVTFTVDHLTIDGYTYAPENNHDPEPDSTGTEINIARP